jgi:hypothetical protein
MHERGYAQTPQCRNAAMHERGYAGRGHAGRGYAGRGYAGRGYAEPGQGIDRHFVAASN